MAAVVDYRIGWSGTRDAEGHREYKLINLVRADVLDGPGVVMSASGLAAIGAWWSYGNDVDPWASCRPNMTVSHHKGKEGQPLHKYWRVEQTFSTKPRTRCQDTPIEDPILEPQKVSGTFVKYLEEAVYDYNGNLILSSSHERLHGSNMEFDANRPTVKIEQNIGQLGLSTFSQMVDTVNNAALWGLGARRIKLSNVTWERKLQGTCDYYYTRIFDFDIRYDGFDRTVADEGDKVLHGHWDGDAWVLDNIGGGAPDPENPQHFDRYQDRQGNVGHAILDGAGKPATSLDAAGSVDVEYYGESNFLALGIPTTF